MKLNGLTVMITGAAGGLGKTCAELFYKEGANVILFDKNKQVLEVADCLGEKAIAIVGNVCDLKDLNNACKLAIDKFSTIDILVCSSGIVKSGNVVSLELEQWNDVIEVNLTGVFLTCKAVLPIMIKRKFGRIITISSHFGQVAAVELAAYCASKAAVIQLTRSIALDFAKYKVVANCICPGYMDTPMLTEIISKVGRNREWVDSMRNLPISNIRIEDVAKGALFLASDAANSMTGSVITIDGGYTAR